MDACYEINDASQILSPSLVVFLEILEANIDKMMAIAGSPERLRPHCKTHKMREVVRMQVARGVTRHKAATFAEAEMLASAG
ncbi:MAG: D-TA family PLP-dependent enzyme, partial [Pirellulaceae bacterium]|nr:D-TA family PLP-dependent enzyme [Pirellulaceae bacterium]